MSLWRVVDLENCCDLMKGHDIDGSDCDFDHGRLDLDDDLSETVGLGWPVLEELGRKLG